MEWLEEDFADACDFEVIGLGCAAGPHRLCWELNGRLGWDLAFHHVIESQQRQGLSEHLVYKWKHAMLVLNKHAEGPLVTTEGIARLDYLLRIGDCECVEEAQSLDHILSTIRSMPLVTLATRIQTSAEGIMEHLAVLDCTPSEAELQEK